MAHVEHDSAHATDAHDAASAHDAHGSHAGHGGGADGDDLPPHGPIVAEPSSPWWLPLVGLGLFCLLAGVLLVRSATPAAPAAATADPAPSAAASK